jgi:hypothetical protein
MDVFYRTHYGNWAKNCCLFTVNFAVPYIYLPSGSANGAAALWIHRFTGTCTAGGPNSFSGDTSTSARRVPVAGKILLVAPPCKPLRKPFGKPLPKASKRFAKRFAERFGC